MERRTLQSAVVAACGIVAVGISAATLTSTVETGAGEGGGLGGSSGGGFPPPPESGGPSIPLPHFPYMEELILLAIAIGLLGTLVYLVLYWRTILYLAVGLTLVIGLSILLVQFLLSAVPSSQGGLFAGTGGGLVGSGGASDGAVPSLPTLLLVLLVLLAGGGIVAAVFGTGRTEKPTASDGGSEAKSESAAVGRAAGAAADRLEAADAALGNEVYRAWREMTTLLDVDSPDTTTPGEFETAAVDAGMSPDDVRELRRLFEDVRYGDREPTEVDERRAVGVFRRIEEAYTPEEEA